MVRPGGHTAPRGGDQGRGRDHCLRRAGLLLIERGCELHRPAALCYRPSPVVRAWVLVNSGLIVAVEVFDVYPFGLLGIILSVEAILITGFLLISQKRQDVHAEKRAELEYEV
ncbi:MAG: DUF1003 domain-containing protein, partial [Gammaproteobacteria bacterium]